MKTYSEEHDCAPINWNDRIGRALALDGNVTQEETMQWSEDAENWVTCACGNLCSAIPRRADGAPADLILCQLGGEFFSFVINNRWERAKKTLERIELISTKILRRINYHK